LTINIYILFVIQKLLSYKIGKTKSKDQLIINNCILPMQLYSSLQFTVNPYFFVLSYMSQYLNTSLNFLCKCTKNIWRLLRLILSFHTLLSFLFIYILLPGYESKILYLKLKGVQVCFHQSSILAILTNSICLLLTFNTGIGFFLNNPLVKCLHVIIFLLFVFFLYPAFTPTIQQ